MSDQPNVPPISPNNNLVADASFTSSSSVQSSCSEESMELDLTGVKTPLSAAAAVEIAEQKKQKAVEALKRAESSQRDITMFQFQREVEEIEAQQQQQAKLISQQRQDSHMQRLHAEELADQKIIDAVCAASLMEYKHRERAEKQASLDEERLETLAQQQQHEINTRAKQARAGKTVAMQTVINMKVKANQLKQKARLAVEQYEQKEKERQENLARLEELNAEEDRKRQLLAVQDKKEAAHQRRVEAEKKAEAAVARAKEMKEKAVLAARLLRQKSRQSNETEYNQLSERQKYEYNAKKAQIEKEKENSRANSTLAGKKAEEARKKAHDLMAKAASASEALNKRKIGLGKIKNPSCIA